MKGVKKKKITSNSVFLVETIECIKTINTKTAYWRNRLNVRKKKLS